MTRFGGGGRWALGATLTGAVGCLTAQSIPPPAVGSPTPPVMNAPPTASAAPALVKPGSSTALNPAASYIAQIHTRIHPIFADGLLATLAQLPASEPMNRPEIYTSLELVIDHEEGRITRMGVTRTSGVTAFDVAALESAYRAQPFGAPPPEIVSPDGNVYLHWEFHRGLEACGSANAHPFMRVQPNGDPGTEPQ